MRGGPPCAAAAGVYVTVVRVNTARQGAGAPLTEDPARWVTTAAAGLGVGLLLRRGSVGHRGIPGRPAGPRGSTDGPATAGRARATAGRART